ncbi:LysR family transcriptional regulator ArgP [Chitinimonas sp. BJB300]|uniref:LysR family transcriptional regulator ArgP n=1 Tax=Chitinimonas sp. BJB300 TaxID=1559339 RepID=UPI000C0D3847|nr:LysR family transcriptional regulator ArgP [Chitinimonas sp. BJB300]PHV10928.1 ArgP/LysG family DNA-binding transcriptional regulator [Chitinimonas sp. BJB300]TSJ89940.1 LysR family transcriptional regulator ArgP [Chitinimonas sp. BJB300]
MALDVRKGEALLAVLETGSFEQAATLLHLTPSAVSQRVKALEEELGTPLMVRTRPCRATKAGQRLAQYLRRSRLLEEEFVAELAEVEGQPVSIPIAVNNDSLATWLLPALSDFLIEKQLLLDITVDDQDHTYAWLEAGQVLAGVSAAATAMRGCRVEPLGVMRYRLLAAPAFVARWFAMGINREAARDAPVLVFNRKDVIQSDFLQRELGLPPASYPCHYIPASESFYQAVRLGLGYGMVPELQYGDDVTRGELIDLAPNKPTDVALYWHHWRVQSPKMERLNAEVLKTARAVLRPFY